MWKKKVLTTHVAAGLELGRHLGIHGDHELALVGHEGVAVLNLVSDPLLERLAYDSCANVHDPLLRHVRKVRLIRKVRLDQGLGRDEGEHFLEREALVVRHVDGLDVRVVEAPLLPHEDIFQEVNGDVVCG